MGIMAKRGAKLKLNDTLQKNICNDIKAGVPITHAAVMHGIDKSTFYAWYNKGEKAKSGKFREFYLEVEEAKSVAIALRVRRIYQAGETDWKSDAWWLERVDPDNFGRKDHHDVKMKAEVKAEVTLNLLDKIKEKRKELDGLKK